jgi:hypothetical protein
MGNTLASKDGFFTLFYRPMILLIWEKKRPLILLHPVQFVAQSRIGPLGM